MSHSDNEGVCPGCMLTKMMLYRNAPEAQLVELVAHVQRFCPLDSSPTCGHFLQFIPSPVIFQFILPIKPLKSSQRSLLTFANEHFVQCDKNVISF